MTVLVPGSALAYKNRMKIADLCESRERAVFENLRNTLRNLGFTGDSGLELVRVSLGKPALDDPMADRERLLAGLAVGFAKQGGFGEKDEVTDEVQDISLYALRKLPRILRDSDFSCICVLRRETGGSRVLDLFPGSPEGGSKTPVLAGLAVDIGTTTVAMVISDLVTGEPLAAGSVGNGQIRYGADVINRIIESTRPGGLERLRTAVVDDCMVPLIRELCAVAALLPEQIYRVAVAANTTMTHLFTGVYGNNLRLEPYIPAFFQTGALRAADLGLA
jgi:hypothetical protein